MKPQNLPPPTKGKKRSMEVSLTSGGGEKDSLSMLGAFLGEGGEGGGRDGRSIG